MTQAAGGTAASWEALLRDSFAALASISMLTPGWEACLRRLDTVTQPPSLRRALAALLTREAAAAASQDGLAFEVGSILGALMGREEWPAKKIESFAPAWAAGWSGSLASLSPLQTCLLRRAAAGGDDAAHARPWGGARPAGPPRPRGL